MAAIIGRQSGDNRAMAPNSLVTVTLQGGKNIDLRGYKL